MATTAAITRFNAQLMSSIINSPLGNLILTTAHCVAEAHRRAELPVFKHELLERLNAIEDYRAGDPSSRYRPQLIELYQPRVEAWTWVW